VKIDKDTTVPYTVFILCGFVYLFLHLAAMHTDTPVLWGVDSWRYFSPWIGYVLFVTGTAAFMPQVRRVLKLPVENGGRLTARLPATVWALIIIPVLYQFRQKTFLLGDGLLRIRSTEGTYWGFNAEEPLDSMLHNTVHYLVRPHFGNRGAEVYQWLSVVIGAVTLLGVVYYIKKLFRSSGERWFAGGLIATAGSVQLFFGYVENYTLLNCLILMFLLSSFLMLKRGKPSIVPAVFFSAAFVSHPVAVVFFPSAVYVYAVVQGGKNIRDKIIQRLVKPAAVVLVFISLILIAVRSVGGSVTVFIESYTHSSNLLPLFPKGGQYSILSPAHILDVMNEIALITPSVIAFGLIVLSFGSLVRSRRIIFLLLSSAGAVFFMVVFNPKLGYARDWDIFAIAAFPLTLILTDAIIGMSKENLYRIGFPLVFVSLLHTASWVAVNASENVSVARYESITQAPWWPESARGLAHDELGQYYFTLDDFDNYIFQYRKAFSLTGNTRYYKNVVKMQAHLMRIGELEEYVNSNSPNPDGWFYLGSAYLKAEQWDDAHRALAKALELHPGYSEIHSRLGQALAMTGKYDEALAEFTQAAVSNEGTEDGTRHLIYNNIGTIHASEKRYNEAIENFTEAVSIKSDFAQGYFSLAKMYLMTHRDSLAVVHARLAARHGYDRAAVEEMIGLSRFEEGR